MGKSIFEISSEFQEIINEIEDCGGEITEEQETALTVTQENLYNKLENYCKVINKYKNDIDACKCEKKRIGDIQKTKENVINKLKNIALMAVETFGYNGKSGNKVIELSTNKLFTRTTKSLNINEPRVKILTDYFLNYIVELSDNGILETGENLDLTGILAAINANIAADSNEDFIPFTLDDLQSININIKFESNLSSLLNFKEIMKLLNHKDMVHLTISSEADKDLLSYNKNNTVSTEVVSTSLSMK